MARKESSKFADSQSTANLGLEAKLWLTADKLRNNMHAAEYKHVALSKTVDDAMVAIERDNARLKSVLPKDYARPGLDKHRLGELIDLIATLRDTLLPKLLSGELQINQ